VICNVSAAETAQASDILELEGRRAGRHPQAEEIGPFHIAQMVMSSRSPPSTVSSAKPCYITTQFGEDDDFNQTGAHQFTANAASSETALHLAMSYAAVPGMPGALDFAALKSHAARAWPEFWQSGGIIDLAASTDPRAAELERRIVLSQYLTKVNAASNWIPQEEGGLYLPVAEAGGFWDDVARPECAGGLGTKGGAVAEGALLSQAGAVHIALRLRAGLHPLRPGAR
jgi:hypothetical protein